MEIEIKALGLRLSDSLTEFCRSQIVEPLRRVYDREGARLEIELSDDNGPKGGIDKRCRLSLVMPFARTLTVIEQSADPFQAVDGAARRLLRLVKRSKSRTLSPPRFPKKYFIAKQLHQAEPGEAASPEDVTVEEDSLAAAEERDRREQLQQLILDRGPG